MHEVEVLGHLLKNEQVTGKEELSVEDGRGGVLGLQRFSGTDEGLLAIVDRFLCQVIEDGGLSDMLAPQRGHEAGWYLDEVLELGKHPNGFLESRVPGFLFVQRLELEELAYALLLLNLRVRKRFSCGYTLSTNRLSQKEKVAYSPRSLSGYARSSALGT